MIRNRNRLPVLALAAVGALVALPTIASAQAQPKRDQVAPQRANESREVQLQAIPAEGKVAKLEDLVGKTAYEFTLTDTEGKEHTLSEYLVRARSWCWSGSTPPARMLCASTRARRP